MEVQERVPAQPEAQGLDRDHLVGRDVAEVHVAAEVLDEPHLLLLAGRLEQQPAAVDGLADLLDEAFLHLAVRVIHPHGARLAALRDHLPRPGLELLLDHLDPALGSEDDVLALAADLAEDGEVLRQALNRLDLLRVIELDRAVRHFEVIDADVLGPGDVVLG